MSSEILKIAKSIETKVDANDKRLIVVEKAINSPDYNRDRLPATAIDHKEEGRGGFKHVGEQLLMVRKSRMNGGQAVDKRLEDLVTKSGQGLNEAVGSEGGFPIAPTFVNEILEIMHSEFNLLDMCDKNEIAAPSVKMPAVDETSRATGSRRGGVRAYWVDEGGTLTTSKPKYRLLEANPHKLAVTIYATEELMADSNLVAQAFPRYAAEEINFLVNDAIINGDAVGKPLGILASPCLVSVAKESGQAAATVLSQNILKMYGRMHARSLPTSCWLINQDVQQSLFQMTIGTAGAQLVVYIPPGGLKDSPNATLMGRPVHIIEQAQSLGTKGDILFADMKQYWAVTRGSINTAMSIHVAFLTDEQTFKFTFRVDGMPWWASALTPYKGSSTQSPFISLDTR